ncbi:PD-(D/E)XK nuclease family protein [Paenibacillus sp. TCA20]|nr:PD-(D/E)XK nuclease family protein [Paenibacillus sp. TCA20]
MITMYPPWSYSGSRAGMFNECLRKYYYHYYGSHNGWKPESADPDQVQTYRLKQLSSLYLIFGNLAHQMCESVIRSWERNRTVPEVPFLQQRMRDLLNKAYVESKDMNGWHLNPKYHTMLSEMYYDEDAKLQNRITSIKARMETVAGKLYESRTWKEIQSGIAHIMEVEKWDHMILHDTKVYVKMDVLYRNEKGHIVIVDWKTGKEDNFTEQLYLYAAYVHEHYNIPYEHIELRVEYLLTGISESYQASQAEIDEVIAKVGREIEEMKSCLADDYYNRPKEIGYFTPMPSERVCGECNFREICSYRAI